MHKILFNKTSNTTQKGFLLYNTENFPSPNWLTALVFFLDLFVLHYTQLHIPNQCWVGLIPNLLQKEKNYFAKATKMYLVHILLKLRVCLKIMYCLKITGNSSLYYKSWSCFKTTNPIFKENFKLCRSCSFNSG